MMKVCDIADWFAPGFSAVVEAELKEVPRFHRKQWEFAQKFQALRQSGVLRDDAVGISFGSGREHLLYSLTNHVGHLWATDLYNPSTAWPGARTTDVDGYVRSNPPFPTRIDRLSARDMDMREIKFPDETFDFAYSSSAVEHIGRWDDFRSHLNEVRRVLKPNGVYVMTTDIIYGPAWEQLGNYKFTPEGLQWWLQESGMAYDAEVDCRIAHHRSNAPVPADIMPALIPDGGNDRPNLFAELLQVQMLMGRHPHSSVILTMRKAPTERPSVRFPGYEETKAFLLKARDLWENFTARSRLAPNPWAYIPAELRSETWATTYMPLGNRPRGAIVRIETTGPGEITIGVNKIHNDGLGTCVVDILERVEATTGDLEVSLALTPEQDWTYAIYGRALNGLPIRNVSVLVYEPEFPAPPPSVVRLVREGSSVLLKSLMI